MWLWKDLDGYQGKNYFHEKKQKKKKEDLTQLNTAREVKVSSTGSGGTRS